MKKLNKGFTLSELIIALGVIAVLCAILLPIVFSKIPNQKTMMAKRSFYKLQSVISEMMNDAACYPDRTSATPPNIGFDDYRGYEGCKEWQTTGTSNDSLLKFTKIFFSRMGVLQDGPYLTKTWYDTNDCISYYVSETQDSMNSNGTSSFLYLAVDVDGHGHGTDCGFGQVPNYAGGVALCDTDVEPDTVYVTIKYNGKIEVPGWNLYGCTWYAEAIQTDHNILQHSD